MTALKLLTRPFSFPHLRRLSNAAAAADLMPSPENSASVLHFFRGRGLGDEVLVGFAPRLLDSKVGEHLPAKFDLLLACGLSVPEAAKVLRYNGLWHGISLNCLRGRLDTLRTIVSDADLPRIIYRAKRTLNSSEIIQRMVDNVSKLEGWGVSEAKIKSFLVCKPSFFQLKPQYIDDVADRAEAEFGVRRDNKMLVYAVIVLYSMRESTLRSKFRVFESFGWERSCVNTLFKSYPNCIDLAEATLLKKLAFLMNEVGFDPSYITKHPVIMGYSLEKRVRPRFELVNALKSKNLLPKEHAFYPTWIISEREFMEKYVVKFMKEEPAICNAYISTLAAQRR